MNIFDPLISGSLSVSGSGEISGDLTVLGTIRGTISGTTDNALTASEAPKYTLTSSFEVFTGSYTTGSFTGSFGGDGSGLYNIPSSGITGLNLSQIGQGSSTASISSTDGLRVNTNTEITGALTVTGQISGSLKGDGSNIYNIPASGVTGLNLTRIADGSATASISSANGLRINSNTEITGTLKLNKVDFSDDIVEITLTDAGGKYYINGVKNPKLSFIKGFKYRFYYDNNNVHPLLFSLTNDGEHNGGVIYSTGVSTGSDPFYVQIEITDATATTFYYFCDHHVGMGNSISVYSDFLSGQASGNLIVVEPGVFATTGSNNFIGIEKISGSLSVTGSVGITGSLSLTGSVDITGSISLNGQAIGTGKLDETTFQSYTSSNDGRVSSIETSTGSLNSFTSSINTTIKTKLNDEGVISGSIQVQITGTTGYSTFSSSVSASVSELSSSVATTTSGLSSSVGSLSSSVSTTTSDLSSSIGSISSSVATTTSGLSSSIGSLSSSVATTTSGLSSSISTISSSLSSTNDTQNNRLGSIETSTSSLNSFTSSINTTIKSKLNNESVISGSVQVMITGTSGYTDFSSSISTSIGGLSSSLVTSINGLSSSIATTTNDLSSSVALTTSGLTFSVSSLSSSAATTTSNLSSSVGSLSSSIATTDLNQNNRLDSIEGKTGSYATTGSNGFNGNQTITGSLVITQNLQVLGSSSIVYSTASQLIVEDNIIVVNASYPAERFAGIEVHDSGSNGSITASLFWDGLNNRWIYRNTSDAHYGGGMFIAGPRNTGSLGDEPGLTNGKLPKSIGGDHIGDSIINETDGVIYVTGSLSATGTVYGSNITAIETSTASLNTFTSSILSAVELTGSNFTIKGNLLVKGTTTNVNTTTLDVDNNLINLNGTGATSAGLRVKDTTGPNQVSGSLLWDATNDYWIAGQLGSEQRLVRETEFTNAVTRIGNVETSTGSLNSFTSSINTTIKSKLNTDGVISSSVQVNHNTTTNYDANQHVDHTAVSISAGSGLSGGGTIASTRTLTLDTGSVHFLDGVKKELNTEGVISSSVQVNHNATTNYVANQHIDHTTVSITAGSGLTGGGDISATRTINIGAGNGITVNADDIAIDTASATFTTGVKSKLNTDGVISGSAQIDGSLLGSNKTITIGSTSTTLGGTSTSLAGLTSVTSTAFTGSLQGGISGNAATVTNGVYTTGDQSIAGVKTFSDTLKVLKGSRTLTIGQDYANHINWDSNVDLALNISNGGTGGIVFFGGGSSSKFSVTSAGVGAFAGNLTAANLSGTNTGDETLSRVNALAITTVGTITSGTWNGTTIAIANGGTGATTAGGARTNLGLVIGTDVLAYRTFGTAAANNTGDFATAAQGTKADAALPKSGGTMTGNLLFSNKGININRDSGTNTGISWYSTSYSSWCDYMSPAAATSCGPNGNITAPAGTYVTSWSLRRFIENSTGYGWTWESGTSVQTTPSVVAELRASDGLFSVSGAIYSAGSLVKTSANSSYSTTFSSVTSVTVTHSLGTKDVAVFVYDSSDNMFWPSSIVTTSTSVVTITFSSSRSGRVVVVR
jgi:hypothetical protein